MIGECDSLAPRKKTLNFVNLLLSVVAGILMIVACASYSANVKTIQSLSFMVLKSTYNVKTPSLSYTTVTCEYIALQGTCRATCSGSAQTLVNGKVADVPSDDKSRDCATAANGKSSVSLYKENPACKTVTSANQAICDLYGKCRDGGNTTMVFAVIGCITALFSVVAFAWRMNSDGVCPKVTAFLLSGVTFIACTTAFGAFQPCAKGFYDQASVIAKSYPDISLSVYPGIGGDMAVASFVFFIYVWLMSIFVPSAEPAANAGLDNKAPQV
jgi:hypothetical protein